jgi:hypothetical protein
VTSIVAPAVMDSISLVRTSQALPPPPPPDPTPTPDPPAA